MRILYIAKHGQVDTTNDDEGAITFALEQLGHSVTTIRECEAHRLDASKLEADFALFHGWYGYDGEVFRDKLRMPKVFWYFDLVDWKTADAELHARHLKRIAWAKQMIQQCDLGFFTDGDWVDRDKTGKAYWLTQGADERFVESWATPIIDPVDVLFVGGTGYGRGSLIKDLQERYGTSFCHVKGGYYGAGLEYRIHSSRVVVAPDTPITDRYWSNRVYNMLRYNAYLLHPYSNGLRTQYSAKLAMYETREHLHQLIEHTLQKPEHFTSKMQYMGHEHTMSNHTYRHRCEQLVSIVKERLL